MSSDDVADLVIVGAGLAGCLTALAFRKRHPDARLVLVEHAAEVAGNHTWCCFASDLDDGADDDDDQSALRCAILDAIVERRWAAHRVRFPTFEREIPGAYLCVTADRLRRVVESDFVATPRSALLTSTSVRQVARHSVDLADGRRIRARRVLDARGARAVLPAPGQDTSPAADGGHQKFLGQELQVREIPARLAHAPLVMDASVPQIDGFRFMYALPLGADRLLLEDTSFSDGPELDLGERREHIAAYARAQGLRIVRVHREEAGVLPMPWSADGDRPAAPSSGQGGCERIGYAAGLFHAGTGYSLAIALEMAVALASSAGDGDGPRGHDLGTGPIRTRVAAQNRFFALLNRLLFLGVPPARRRGIFERFYGLPDDTIRRFYGARTTWRDRARMLVGRPPPGFRWRQMLAPGARVRSAAEPSAGPATTSPSPRPGSRMKEAT